MTGYFHAAPRAPHAGDAEPVRALVFSVLGVTPYVDRVVELLASAEHGDPDSQALIIERDGTVAALALYGPIAGTANAWRLANAIVSPQVDIAEVGHVIVDAVVARARSAGGRLLVAEIADDLALGRSLALLQANGFKEEGRVRDFFRAGVALIFLRRDL
jgi:L-amino acid N-acyltransferase YncA